MPAQADRPPSLAELAEHLQLQIQGDGSVPVDSLASLDSAGPGQLSFCELGTAPERIAASRASALLLPPQLADRAPCAVLLSDKPRVDFARLTRLYDRRPPPAQGVHPSAVLAEDAQIHPSASIGPGVVVEAGARIGEQVQLGPGTLVGPGAEVGAGSRLYAGVVLYDGVRLGENCILHSGSVIGADGFGFVSSGEAQVKFHQLGGTIIGDDFECGALVTIDRGALDDTLIGKGVKLDDQVHIGHGAQIGDHTVMAGFVGIGGGVKIGAWCAIGGGSIVLPQVQIADRVFVEATSMVGRSVREAGARVSSNWSAEDAKLWRKWQLRMRRNRG